MTPKVRNRIEQIRRGKVPKGYKKTKVGIFPDKWELRYLNELLEFKNGINADKERFGQGVKVISVRDILSDRPITYGTIRGSVEVNERQIEEFGVEYGDILFQRSSENYEDAGTSNVYLDRCNTAVFSGFVIRGKKISAYNPVYLNALLRAAYVRKAIIRQSAGAQHINIGQESLARVCIVLANDVEQKKIAEILTAQDKVIELKEKRLAEKQRQKKYLMQQLLTGKKRLKGFNGEWINYRLNQITKRIKCKNEEANDNVLTISAQHGLINQTDFFNKEIASADKRNYYLLRRDDFAYNKSYSSGYPFGAIKRLTRYDVGIVSPLYICFQISAKEVSLEYIEQYFEAGLINREIQACAQEGARNHGLLNIAIDDFFNIKIVLPYYKEQLVIAKILKSKDSEIDLLRQDIEQEKRKKKALMQLLLTGIVRVPIKGNKERTCQ